MSNENNETLEQLETNADQALELLCEFINTSSPTGHEASLARLIVQRGREMGLRTRLQQVGPDRANAILHLEGDGKGPSLLFNGHMDTSYTGEEEFLQGIGYKAQPVVRDGWVFGLGSNNMKSGLAAAFMAMTTLAQSGIKLAGDITVAAVAGEIEKASIDEFQGPDYMGYGFGTRQLIAHGVSADYAVVCEPTGFQLSHGQLGTLWVQVGVYGDMRHTTFMGDEMDHAIYKACQVAEAIREWGIEYGRRNVYQGQVTRVHVGAIKGGWPWRISRTPQACQMYVDIRLNPETRPESVLQEFKEVVKHRVTQIGGDTRVEIDPYVIVPSIVADTNSSVFEALKTAHKRAFGTPPNLIFRGPMADSVHFNAVGIPTATYGLGPLANFDEVNEETGEIGEQIRVNDYLKLIGIYIETAKEICGVLPD